MLNLLKETLLYVAGTLIHNAPVLAFGILVAAAITVYVDPDKMRSLLMKKSGASIGGSVAFGAFTPFCACGTMAVIVAMMTTALPWGPIMAFLTSSPLMSPDEFILYSGIISVKFAIALTVASVIIGLGSGYITYFIEKKTNFLKGQARFAEKNQVSSCCAPKAAESCCTEAAVAAPVNSCCNSKVVNSCSCESSQVKELGYVEKYKLKELFKVFYEVGIKQVLLYFTVFAAIGFLINKFVPAELIIKFMSSGNKLAVPLMALVGLPLYVSGSSAIPIINALISGGASQGALLAFMITGPGTSAGVIAGLVTIMRKKAIVLYVVYLLVFAVALGYLYDFLLLLGL
ncbi:MAG: permease [Pseudomonadota bacterium]